MADDSVAVVCGRHDKLDYVPVPQIPEVLQEQIEELPTPFNEEVVESPATDTIVEPLQENQEAEDGKKAS